MREVTVDSGCSAAMGMVMRSATVRDIPGMRALEGHAATAARWTKQAYEQLFCQGGLPRLILVLEQGSNLVGFIVALCVGSEWEVENIAVAGNLQRRGLGSWLLRELKERAWQSGAEGLFLEARESNRAARALYEKCGFVQTGKRTAYYSEPAEDAILYQYSSTAGKTLGK